MKAIVLFSGGLDSLLTACILKEQGFDVIGLNIITPFHDCSALAAEYARKLEIEFVTRTLDESYMRMVANPRWGYGKALNPCIDCRIRMCRAAAELMTETGAAFVATGEIVGQRPNSQKMHQLSLITRESGLGDRLLRPLCAKTLPPTAMELDGTVDRERLHAYTGRHRVSLIALARRRYKIEEIPQPSTGCLLCEKSYEAKLRDMFRYKSVPTRWDAAILGAGRQIRLSPDSKCVVGRRETDCQKLERAFDDSERSRAVLLLPLNFQGPAAMLVTDKAPAFDEEVVSLESLDESLRESIRLVGAFILKFTRPDKYAEVPGGPQVEMRIGRSKTTVTLDEAGARDMNLDQYRNIE